MEPLALLLVFFILIAAYALNKLIPLVKDTIANWEKNAWVYNWPRCPYCDHPVDTRKSAVEYGDQNWHPACYMAESPHRKNLDESPRVGRPGPPRKEIR